MAVTVVTIVAAAAAAAAVVKMRVVYAGHRGTSPWFPLNERGDGCDRADRTRRGELMESTKGLLLVVVVVVEMGLMEEVMVLMTLCGHFYDCCGCGCCCGCCYCDVYDCVYCRCYSSATLPRALPPRPPLHAY